MYYRYLFFLLILFLSCENSGNSEKSVKSKKSSSTKQKKAKEVDNVILDKKNAVSFLTEYGEYNLEANVIMKTSLGDIHITLFKETPLHRANFLRLVKKKFYDKTLFYRVIKGFVVQGGGSDDLSHGRKKRKIGKYTLPAEFKSQLYHKKGVIAAARNYDNNPEKRSNPFDFYFVHGAVYDKVSLESLATEKNIVFSQEQKQAYLSIGGTPHLDGEHTVFGEVTKGLDVIDAIAEREVGEGDWPLENVYIESITIVK